jgi:glycosyltransferase involved in cell wall biosynthesis
MLLAPDGYDHHFGALPEVLERQGDEVALETLQPHAPLRVSDAMGAACAAIVHVEGVVARATGVRRAAARTGTPLVLLMDGVLEYANTFLNTGAGPTFLRPCPADVVFCAGPHDRAILRALGNRAVATGLPRLEAFTACVRQSQACATPRGLMIATANTPSFTFGGRVRLLKSLDSIRTALARRGVPVRWRIAGELAADLGVEVDGRPLAESLSSVRGVITTASTLAVEAMLAGKPTGVLHPHPWPLWLPSAWVHRGDAFDGMDEDSDRVQEAADAAAAANAAAEASGTRAAKGVRPYESFSAGDLVDSLLAPSNELMELQERFKRVLCRREASSRVAEACRAVTPDLRRRSGSAAIEATRVVAGTGAPEHSPRALRVVSCIESHASSVGGVSAWSERMEAAFARDPGRGIEWWTLFVAADGPPATERPAARPRARACVVDPTEATALQAEAVANAIRDLGADVVLPNYGSLAFAAAQHERARSCGRTRVVAVAHTNDDVYRGMLASHESWDAAVAVSEACAAWLAPLAGERPMRTIVYGVPLGRAPRGSMPGPLRLAYVGRVVEKQKRVGDLLVLMTELERLGVAYEFDVVGDGDALRGWQRRLSESNIRSAVRVHGPRELGWVQRFWARIDVNVIVSDAEGTSIAMLESMAHGVIPCITAVDAGATAIVRDGVNGIAVAVGDMKAMASRLAEIAADVGLRRSMGASAYRTIAENGLTVDACVDAWEACLKDVASGVSVRASRSDAAVRSVAASPTTGPLQETDAVRLLHEAGFVTCSSPGRSGEASVVTASMPHPGTVVISQRRASGIATAVCPSQCDDGWTHFGERYDELVRNGQQRIGVWVGRSVPRAVVEWLASQPAPFVGFIRHDARPGTTLLGARVLSPAAALQEAIDGVLLCEPPGDVQGLAATHSIRAAGVEVRPVMAEGGLAEHVDDVCRRVLEVRQENGGIVTTCDRGVIPGAAVVAVPWATHMQPRCLVLRGDESDFAAFAASKRWRDCGTVAMSLRFSAAELSSPERYAAIVSDLAPATPFAIYGGGRHTERLLTHSAVRKPLWILDDRGDGSRAIASVPVVSPESVEDSIPPVVILSSPKHEEQMWLRSDRWRARGVEVVGLYRHALAGVTTPLSAGCGS